MIRTSSLGMLLFASLPMVGSAQEPAGRIPSGPAVGSAAEPALVHAPVGPRAGQEYDAAALVAPKTGALLFIHELTRNTAPVIRGLDEIGQEFALLGFRHQITLLESDRTAAETRLRAVNGSLRLHEPITLALGGGEGPGAYALDRKATLTLVLFQDGKVARSTGFTDTGPNDVPVIRRWVEELTGPLPTNDDELRKLLEAQLPQGEEALRAHAIELALEVHRLRRQLQRQRENARGMDRTRPMRERPNAQGTPPQRPETPNETRPVVREGGPPSDGELQGLLRSFIRKTNDDATVDRVFADIEARAKTSEDLTHQAVEMFRLVLSMKDRYGTEHAHGLAEQFVRTYRKPAPAVGEGNGERKRT
ncbi:MAG: hypothetical protein H6833_12655 [Planctomycetes bacterium]|nr:hypothetical protein [Planctomycetota bacterium]